MAAGRGKRTRIANKRRVEVDGYEHPVSFESHAVTILSATHHCRQPALRMWASCLWFDVCIWRSLKPCLAVWLLTSRKSEREREAAISMRKEARATRRRNIVRLALMTDPH